MISSSKTETNMYDFGESSREIYGVWYVDVIII